MNSREKLLRSLSPRVLAYIGDAVYELHMRKYILQLHNAPVASLQPNVVQRVSAVGQMKALQRIENLLTEDELDIVRRGCNIKHKTKTDKATRCSTGIEALIGYLHLLGYEERLCFLLQAIEKNDNNMYVSSNI